MKLIKRTLLLFTTTLTLLSTVMAQQHLPEARYGENLAANPGFEDGTKSWAMKAGTARVVDDVARSGKHSLFYENNDIERYELFSQNIAVQPGQNLVFSAWVKSEALTATNAVAGASIYLQSYVDGRYAGGMFPTGVAGDGDWRQIRAVYTVPPEAQRVSLGLRFLKGTLGKAWFDDIEVRVEIPPLLESFLVQPAYRGLVKHGDRAPWKVLVRQHPEAGNSPALTATFRLLNSQAKVLHEQRYPLQTKAEDRVLNFTPPALAAGKYQLQLQYRLPGGELYLAREQQIQVVEKLPATRIDEQGFTVKNGERIFPLGLYLGPTQDEHLARISKAGFNTILSYSYGQGKDPVDFLNRAQKHNLHVVYSVKDFYTGLKAAPKEGVPLTRAGEYVDLLKQHPALLAWYTNDELNPEWIPQIEEMQRMIAERDPNHPTFQVLYQVGQLEKYYDAADIISTDPYPVGKENLTQTSIYTRRTLEAAHGARAAWIVPQIMDWAVYTPGREPKPPTLDEMRNQSYQALINGATGLIYYAYQDLFQEKYPRGPLNQEAFDRRWPDIVAMTQELKPLLPAILHGKPVALKKPVTSKIEASAIEYQGEMLVLLANPYYEKQSVTLELPQGWQPTEAKQEQIGGVQNGTQITLTVNSIGSGVYRLRKP